MVFAGVFGSWRGQSASASRSDETTSLAWSRRNASSARWPGAPRSSVRPASRTSSGPSTLNSTWRTLLRGGYRSVGPLLPPTPILRAMRSHWAIESKGDVMNLRTKLIGTLVLAAAVATPIAHAENPDDRAGLRGPGGIASQQAEIATHPDNRAGLRGPGAVASVQVSTVSRPDDRAAAQTRERQRRRPSLSSARSAPAAGRPSRSTPAEKARSRHHPGATDPPETSHEAPGLPPRPTPAEYDAPTSSFRAKASCRRLELCGLETPSSHARGKRSSR